MFLLVYYPIGDINNKYIKYGSWCKVNGSKIALNILTVFKSASREFVLFSKKAKDHIVIKQFDVLTTTYLDTIYIFSFDH